MVAQETNPKQHVKTSSMIYYFFVNFYNYFFSNIHMTVTILDFYCNFIPGKWGKRHNHSQCAFLRGQMLLPFTLFFLYWNVVDRSHETKTTAGPASTQPSAGIPAALCGMRRSSVSDHGLSMLGKWTIHKVTAGIKTLPDKLRGVPLSE